ncbi:hypothetical protein TRIP_C60364 [Candidatus Zixiibacteriota bacterium]|nr:hypothetical protein TRIP_C60364 [candidate division Zixibacteria bacterium]
MITMTMGEQNGPRSKAKVINSLFDFVIITTGVDNNPIFPGGVKDKITIDLERADRNRFYAHIIHTPKSRVSSGKYQINHFCQIAATDL